ncbi:L-threonylcarbamoyladenylate synthase [Pedobacter insulae]|uniref:L-threonylcarbamoyladenylate synthase n=1 Tax=Pedobacter insulae TaxID=414048 RepID=A0A1I2XX31_9SPHI|nr:L-threonylcarbamoyladenylate synthase [Pedobacter insulae]SFH18038.1 L-threonylcarbamoyladenylate synthase [Pedobacter insulae]
MLKEEITRALAVLNKGGVILYPTDTVWGLGCDATNEDAVAKINAIKGRAADKSFIVLLASDNQLQSYVTEIPDVAYELIEYAENPLTIIFQGAKNLAKNAINIDGSIGIRVVKHDFCEALIQRLRRPIISTSANLSGQPTPSFFDEISQDILDAVDYVVGIDQELRLVKKPSTIVKLGPTGQFEFIRK